MRWPLRISIRQALLAVAVIAILLQMVISYVTNAVAPARCRLLTGYLVSTTSAITITGVEGVYEVPEGSRCLVIWDTPWKGDENYEERVSCVRLLDGPHKG